MRISIKSSSQRDSQPLDLRHYCVCRHRHDEHVQDRRSRRASPVEPRPSRPCTVSGCYCHTYQVARLPLCDACNHTPALHAPRTARDDLSCKSHCSCPGWTHRADGDVLLRLVVEGDDRHVAVDIETGPGG